MVNAALTEAQADAVTFIATKKRCIVNLDMGMGKTLVALKAIEQLNLSKVLIVAPANVKSVWETELSKWGLEGGKVIEGNRAARTESLKARNKYTIINYEMLRPEKYPDIFLKDWDVCFFDEAHFLKNRKSIRTKNAGKVKSERVIFMTGTLFSTGAGDVWPMLNIIDKKAFSSYWAFVNKYSIVCHTMYGVTVKGVRDKKALAKLLYRYCISATLENPKSAKEKHCRKVEFSPTQQRIYDKLVRDFKYGDTIAASTMEKFIRLQQLSCSPAILNLECDDAMTTAILQDITKIEEKIIIAGVYVKHVEVLQNSIAGRLTFAITGKTKDKAGIIEAWRQSKNGILITTIACLNTGYSFDFCNHMIFADITFSYVDNLQFSNRIYRMTSYKDKHYYYYLAQGVISFKHNLVKDTTKMVESIAQAAEDFRRSLL